MPFIGNQPAKVPLTSADITDGIIVNADINANAAIASSKLSITSPLSITGNSTAGSEIRLPEDTDNGSNYVALKAADSITSNLTFTLPSADGSANQALITNGSGSLSFATVGAAAGQVIQVLSATDDNSRSTTSTSFVTASNTLSVTITPAATANKIFIIVSLPGFRNDGNGQAGYATVYRGSTNLGTTNGGLASEYLSMDGSVQSPQYSQNINFSYLDSPSTTSATTYQVYMRATAGTTGFNQLAIAARATITLMEVKG